MERTILDSAFNPKEVVRPMPWFVCLFALLMAVPPASTEQKGVGFEERATASPGYYAASHAVCVGINDYESWPDLSYAEEDARAMAALLEAQGFAVKLLIGRDATRKETAITIMTTSSLKRENADAHQR